MYYKIHPMGNNVDRDVVAKKAGVSSATVSRVFNHPGKVSPEKRDLVLSAAEELQYRPNLNASILYR
jgi:LacI family transcriptional regulator